jgi:hypothetical protein
MKLDPGVIRENVFTLHFFISDFVFCFINKIQDTFKCLKNSNWAMKKITQMINIFLILVWKLPKQVERKKHNSTQCNVFTVTVPAAKL